MSENNKHCTARYDGRLLGVVRGVSFTVVSFCNGASRNVKSSAIWVGRFQVLNFFIIIFFIIFFQFFWARSTDCLQAKSWPLFHTEDSSGKWEGSQQSENSGFLVSSSVHFK